MRDKVERILMKFGGLNLWSSQVRNSLIDELDKELNFGTSGDTPVKSKEETTANTTIKTEDLPTGNRQPYATGPTPSRATGPTPSQQVSVDDGDEERTSKRDKKTVRGKKSNTRRRSSKKSRVKSDNRNIEDIEMLPKSP